MPTNSLNPEQSALGKKAQYDSHYNPDLLFPLSRQPNRVAIGVSEPLPFFGVDVWNHYEVSWLNEKGRPIAALAEITYGCDSKNIIESKSMKLYFNSFNNSAFKDVQTVETTVKKDLDARLGGSSVSVRITPLSAFSEHPLARSFTGIYLDDLDIDCSEYHVNPNFLFIENEAVAETLCSDLLKSNCLVTNQPDWCSVQITYKGQKINHEGLLRYIVSFRNDNEFHEQCIEKIFMHLLMRCRPVELTVCGRSTRRGGLDINSCRSTHPIDLSRIPRARLCRQ